MTVFSLPDEISEQNHLSKQWFWEIMKSGQLSSSLCKLWIEINPTYCNIQKKKKSYRPTL